MTKWLLETRSKHLSRIRDLCDSWIESRYEEFNPFSWSNADERFTRRKAFAEAALYLYVARAFGDDAHLPYLQNLVIKNANDPRYLDLLRRHPRHITLFSSAVLYAKASDQISENLLLATKLVLDGKAAWGFERVPHRILDFWHFYTAFGYKSKKINLNQVVKVSCLANCPPAWECTLSDAYALTHVLLFVHNFGVRTSLFPGNPLPYDLTDDFEGLMLRFISEDNADIVLELLLSAILQHQLRQSFCAFVIDWIVEKVNQLGYVPGPFPLPVEEGMSASAFDLWSENYHTILVAGTTMRILERHWQSLTENTSSINDNLDVEGSLILGKTLECLAKYELPLAISLLKSLIGTSTQQRYKHVFAEAVHFLSEQENSDGTFGFWTDETVIYEPENHCGGSFTNEILEPMSQLWKDFQNTMYH